MEQQITKQFSKFVGSLYKYSEYSMVEFIYKKSQAVGCVIKIITEPKKSSKDKLKRTTFADLGSLNRTRSNRG